MIIRKCISTASITDVISALQTDLYSTGLFSQPVTTQDEDNVYIKLYYTEAEYIQITKPNEYSRFSVSIHSSSDSFTTDITSIGSDYYVSYTVVSTSNGSLALAVNNKTSNAEADRYTNDLQLFITNIGGVKAAFTDDSIMYNSVKYTNSIVTTLTSSTLDWVQLVPFGSPELGGVSSEVFMIRYTPATQTEITVNTQPYLFGDNFAIKLEATA